MQKSKNVKQKFFNTVVVNYIEYNEDSDFYTAPAPSAIPAMPDVRYILGHIVPFQNRLSYLSYLCILSYSFNSVIIRYHINMSSSILRYAD